MPHYAFAVNTSPASIALLPPINPAISPHFCEYIPVNSSVLVFMFVLPLCPACSPRGRWENKTTKLPQGWMFFSDEESHHRTERNWADSGLKLTGVVAGRQTWDRAGDGDEMSPGFADEDLTFNPSVNPNSGDKILRAQQVRIIAGRREAGVGIVRGRWEMVGMCTGHGRPDYFRDEFLPQGQRPSSVFLAFNSHASFPTYSAQI